MKAALKRFLIIFTLLFLSISSAVATDRFIDKKEMEKYPIEDTAGLYEAVISYSEKYSIPPEVIYTVIRERSGVSASYTSGGRIGYMALSADEVKKVGEILELDITSEMLLDPSNSLLLGVTYLSDLYSKLGEWNAVYAALIIGDKEVLLLADEKELHDVTGALISLPEGYDGADAFARYLETEEKYRELYFKADTEETGATDDKNR